MLPAPFDRLDLIVGGVDDNGSRVAVMIAIIIIKFHSTQILSSREAAVIRQHSLKREERERESEMR